MQFLRCFGPYTVFDFVFLLFWFYGSFGPLCFLWCLADTHSLILFFYCFGFLGVSGHCVWPFFLINLNSSTKLSFLTFFTSVYFYLFGQKKKKKKEEAILHVKSYYFTCQKSVTYLIIINQA